LGKKTNKSMAEKEKSTSGQQQQQSSLTLRQRKRFCYFCKENINTIDYKNVGMLKKFVSDKSKIRPKRSTGNCVQHQKMIAAAIKRAREMALMSYFKR
jgi:small subunit ribosomal protein S18